MTSSRLYASRTDLINIIEHDYNTKRHSADYYVQLLIRCYKTDTDTICNQMSSIEYREEAIHELRNDINDLQEYINRLEKNNERQGHTAPTT